MRWVLFDWGGTLMSEDGPLDLPMALWPEVRPIDGARDTLERVARMARIGIATNASDAPHRRRAGHARACRPHGAHRNRHQRLGLDPSPDRDRARPRHAGDT